MRIALTLPPFDTIGIESGIRRSGGEFKSIREEILCLIEGAEEKIEICSPFIQYKGFLDDVYSTLKRKLSENVEVRIIARQIEKNDPDTRYYDVKRLYNEYFKNESGFEIRNYHYEKHRVMSSTHAKFMVVDGESAYVGSGELRRNSFEKNFEIGVVFEGTQAEELSYLFKELFKVSRKVFPKEGK